ncbi:DUF2861 family protein [Vibrio chagasii]|nr:DUF2861 family protein [Vibrio chagasii]
MARVTNRITKNRLIVTLAARKTRNTTRTQCGRTLKQSDTHHHIQVSFIKRYGLSSQGYQIKNLSRATQQ